LALDVAASATLGYLPNLRLLNLHGNLLTGAIPDNLGRLALLEDLDLSRNRFTGIASHMYRVCPPA
jgi:Leucine-rich repeat (LRR) protein